MARVSGRLEADGTGFLEGTRPTPLGDTPFRIRITSEDDAEVHRYYEASPRGKEVLFLELRYRPVG